LRLMTYPVSCIISGAKHSTRKALHVTTENQALSG
jgi:hypothetical protein